MTEVWKAVPGFDGYEVSDHGRVRSYLNGRWGLRETPRLLKNNKRGLSYHGVSLSRNGKSHAFSVHGLVMLAFVGPAPDGMEVCHNNSVPTDNRLCNLRYDTHAGNARDRCALTDAQIVIMRERRADGETLSSLAKHYGISTSHVNNICSGNQFIQIGGPRSRSIAVEKKRHFFSAAQVLDIRNRYQSEETLKSIAIDYGASMAHISRIGRGLSCAALCLEDGPSGARAALAPFNEVVTNE